MSIAALTEVTITATANCPTCPDSDPRALTAEGESGYTQWSVENSRACPVHETYRVQVTDEAGTAVLTIRSKAFAADLPHLSWLSDEAEALLLADNPVPSQRLLDTVLGLRTVLG